MRTTEKHKIIIVEPAEIIQQGLTQILKNYIPGIEVINCHTVSELHAGTEKEGLFLVMINTSLIENTSAISDHAIQQAHLIGIVSNCFYREHTNLFDDLIYITDHAEKIVEVVKKYLYQQPKKLKILGVKLTNRELDVLKRLIKGYSNKQISSELNISIHTVISHRQNITVKLGIKSIAGLTIYGVINNIIDVEDYLDQ